MLLAVGMAASASAAAAESPLIPVGADAYVMWDRWAYQRIGERAYMRSTYDRAGGNASGDASHFLYQLADDFNVTLDVEGPGILYFARYNHWHGSPWHYEVDHVDHLVQETSTADPLHPSIDSVLFSSVIHAAGIVKWRRAGAWYLAGSDRTVLSKGSGHGELGATEHIEETSNRRFRDDEFLLPRDATHGRRAIRIRIRFTPVSIPLFPGQALPELAWSEMRYTVYSIVMPDFKLY